MKNKIIKYTLNGVILAAMAAIGITAYQIGTTPTEEKIIQELENGEADSEDVAKLEIGAEASGDAEKLENGTESADVENLEADVAEDEDLDEWDVEDFDSASEEAGSTDVEAEVQNGSENDELSTSEETSVESDLIDVEVPDEGWESVDASSKTILEQLSFSESTGMQWPVHGSILLDYDMTQSVYFPTLDQYRLSSAIAVQAAEGEPVTAAASGMVYSITQDARTGTTVTMELGDGYQAIYGQLKDLTVEEGQMVEQGTIIGYVSAPTKYYSVEGSNLYFAMKQNGEAIDPGMYLPE